MNLVPLVIALLRSTVVTAHYWGSQLVVSSENGGLNTTIDFSGPEILNKVIPLVQYTWQDQYKVLNITFVSLGIGQRRYIPECTIEVIYEVKMSGFDSQTLVRVSVIVAKQGKDVQLRETVVGSTLTIFLLNNRFWTEYYPQMYSLKWPKNVTMADGTIVDFDALEVRERIYKDLGLESLHDSGAWGMWVASIGIPAGKNLSSLAYSTQIMVIYALEMDDSPDWYYLVSVTLEKKWSPRYFEKRHMSSFREAKERAEREKI